MLHALLASNAKALSVLCVAITHLLGSPLFPRLVYGEGKRGTWGAHQERAVLPNRSL
jgi:hypothetical protein